MPLGTTSTSTLRKKRLRDGTNKVYFAKDKEGEAAAAASRQSARTIVPSAHSLGAYLNLSPKRRLCWTPTHIFPPILETTIECGTVIRPHGDMKWLGPGSTSTKSRLIEIMCNSPPTVWEPSGTSTTDYGDRTMIRPAPHKISPGTSPSKIAPFHQKLNLLYSRHAVVSSRVTVKVRHRGNLNQAETFNIYLKRFTPSNIDSKSATIQYEQNQWNIVEGTVTNKSAEYHEIDFANYANQGRGSFHERAHIFEENLKGPVKLKPRLVEQQEAPVAVISDHWDLLADSGVALDDLMDANGEPEMPTEAEPLANHVGAGWSAGPDFHAEPYFRPRWYLFCMPTIADHSWDEVDLRAHAPDQDGGIKDTAGTVDVAPIVEITVQYDLIYYQYRKNDEPFRDEVYDP